MTEDALTQQYSAYGATVAAVASGAQSVLGVPAGELPGLLGISEPMLAALVTGTRARIGNPVATGRFLQLKQLIEQVSIGATALADVPLTLAQIRASTIPAVPGEVTAQAVPSPVPPPVPPTAAPQPGSGSGAPPGAPSGAQAAPATAGPLITAASLTYARSVVARHVPATPTYRWPLLEQRLGTELWVKHENHTPVGAFKVRGGLNYLERLRVHGARPAGLVSATRGNHGQSLAYAGRAYGVPVTIVVPECNSPDKSAAMAALGARVVVHGHDFQAALEHSQELAAAEGLTVVPAFHPWLVEGVATLAAELHEQVQGIDVVYVPVGMGSGIAAQINVRDLLGLATEVVGVVAAGAPAQALSFAAGRPVATERADTFVDGVACRVPDPGACAVIRAGASRIVEVSEEQAAAAMREMYAATHNLAEPAGSLALAGALAERERLAGRRVAIVHTGGNCDAEVLLRALG
ncbi:threonine dehydratase [Nocardioides daejeonensis]|uniref:threonine dehydratase n=1 Tax=Nocardioides daejeonensis TaxID=1046556 RepID=UPI001EF4731C|nr:threonine dehydratase [Nocardioides daejeonensis]